MNNLRNKIKTTLDNDKQSGHVRLTAEELQKLVKMQKVKHFTLHTGLARYTDLSTDDGRYFRGIGSIQLSRPQAIQLANDFNDAWQDNEGNELFAEAYISKWERGEYYVAFAI